MGVVEVLERVDCVSHWDAHIHLEVCCRLYPLKDHERLPDLVRCCSTACGGGEGRGGRGVVLGPSNFPLNGFTLAAYV